ncbi:hypothetical protein GAYE_SCF00G1706 [Galdieria yellowstonensis]|uniref:Uncharacterized protein n=1 Tax=Galdieria yellowstonensis TaxID=3028027 RepID=A0AAV9I8R0_9RHOD|nr:hypothetical protein GAYE_SCF00G1706 [Galdieria yellowstonensis]
MCWLLCSWKARGMILVYVAFCLYHLWWNELEFSKTPCLKIFSLSGYILARIFSLEFASSTEIEERSSPPKNTFREPLIIVIPFTSGQQERLVRMLSLLERIPPCRPRGPVRYLPTIAFYYHASLETLVGRSIQQNISAAWESLPHSVRDCFHKDVIWKGANLSGTRDLYSRWDSEAYSAGTNNMFYGIMRDDAIARKYQYMFYCEPDVTPIREGWLEKLVELSLQSSQHKVWMIGSVYQGTDFGAVLSWALQYRGGMAWRHLNGNALYRLGDACFQSFLFQVEKKYYPMSFDISIYRYFYSLKNPILTSKFMPTNIIIHIGNSYVHHNTTTHSSQYSHTYLVHGKNFVFD